MERLKRCPFCGGESELFQDDGYLVKDGRKLNEKMFFVWCAECTALVAGNTEQEVVEAWNRRIKDADL